MAIWGAANCEIFWLGFWFLVFGGVRRKEGDLNERMF
jgi:hypothetical protein